MNPAVAAVRDSGGIQVHSLPECMDSPVHKKSGLQIFRWNTEMSSRNDGGLFLSRMRYFEFYCISHMYRGNGLYLRSGAEPVPIRPGQCVLVSPGTVHTYGAAPHSEYCEDTVNFTGPLANMLFSSGVFADGVFDLGLSRLLLTVCRFAADPSEHSQLNANFALQKILYDLYNRRFEKTGGEQYPRIEELLSHLREDHEHWWTVKEMSEFCNMSDDQLRRVFLRYTGTLPKLYLDKLKLTHAASLLAETGLTLSEIAAKVGYSDPFHFSRRFKAVMGFSPRRYRLEIVNSAGR